MQITMRNSGTGTAAWRRSGLQVASLVLALQLAGAARAETIDFDDLSPGSVVTTIDGVSFSLGMPGLDLVVATGLATTSLPNYLGVDDSGAGPFLPGDVLTLSFSVPVVEISLVVVSTAGTPLGAFELSTDGGSDTSGAPDETIAGDEVHRLAVSSAVPLSDVELRAAGGGLFAFNVDDVAFVLVPEPGTAMLVAVGLALLSHAGRVRDERFGGFVDGLRRRLRNG